GTHRGIGISALYYVDYCLRRSGFYATPRTEPECTVSIPAQYSMWPEYGKLLTCSRGTVTGSWPLFRAAPWGLSVGDFVATVDPQIKSLPSRPVQLTACVDTAHAGTFVMKAEYG